MGLPHAAMEWTIVKGPDEFNTLTKAEADRLGIAVDVYDAKAAAGPRDRTR